MSASPLNLATGSAAWQVTQTSGTNNGLGIGTTASAVVLTGTLPFAANLPGFESFVWANPFGGANWIGQLATDGNFSNGTTILCPSTCGAEAGMYTYTLTFNAPFGGNLVLNGFTGDNGVRTLSVSSSASGTIYRCTAGGPGTLCAGTQNAVTASTGKLNFGSGTVTITATVENLIGPGRNPSGFLLAGSANDPTADPFPEPSTYAMLVLGGGVMLFARLRRK